MNSCDLYFFFITLNNEQRVYILRLYHIYVLFLLGRLVPWE
jgi:hypothetical protein